MKKAFLKLMCLVLGLNVFTACYGPAPYSYDDPENTEQSDGTKAGTEEEAEEEATSESSGENA